MDTILQDLRFALRSLWRARAFTTAAVLTLALGIGANSAIFSVVDGVLLRPAPFAGTDRLTMVWETDRKSGTTHEPSSIPDFRDFQQRSRQFAQLAAFTGTEVNVTRQGSDPARVAALAVTESFLPMLGVQPLAGRLLSPDETRASGARGVLISEALWDTQFERSPQAIGRTIRLDDVEWTIVGVVPRTADFGMLQTLKRADYGRSFSERGDRTRVDVWFGLRDAADAPRDNHPIFVMGRLAPGATLASARQELGRIATELERAFPSNDARGVSIDPWNDVIFGGVRPALLVLLGAVALVLLVACGNVANLLLVRGAARTRELTVRIALGAGRRRLAQQFLVESSVITLAGATLGVLLAYGGLGALLALAPSSLPRVDDVGIDTRVLVVTLLVSVGVAVLFGALPLLQSGDGDLNATLQSGSSRGASGGRAQRRFRSGLVVAELAMAVTLMTGAGLLIKSLWQLQRVDPGFESAGVLKAEFQLPESRYPQDRATFPNWPAQQRFYGELESRLRAIPGITGTAIAAANPLDAGFTSSISIVGREAESADFPEPSVRSVSAPYFETMKVPVTAGRVFDNTDAATSTPVIVINRSAHERFFNGGNAIGQRIGFWGTQRLVVGIVGNERFKGLAEATPPAVYVPLTQVPIANAVLVRTTGDPTAMTATVRRVVHEIDPQLPLFGVELLDETIAQSIGERRFVMIALGAFAVVALLLAAIGVHGVLSYTVAQRTREIGIRVALGAAPGAVRALVMSQGAVLTGAGLLLGIAGSLALSRVLSALLYGVGAQDPLTLVLVSLLLAAVALLACYLPARRAARVDPMVALRADG